MIWKSVHVLFNLLISALHIWSFKWGLSNNQGVNDEFYYKFSKKGEFGQTEFVTEKVTLIGIERTDSAIFKYIARFTFKGRTFYCSDWKLQKEVIEETNLSYER